MFRWVVLAAAIAGCDDAPSTPATHDLDPLACPASFTAAGGAACADEHATCHYTGDCGSNCTCTNGAFACGDSGRFSCGDCASDVRCAAGEFCNAEGATCGCAPDGVFDCLAGTAAPTTDLPACPLVSADADGASCPVAQQVCDYFETRACIDVCTCTAGTFACESTCGA